MSTVVTSIMFYAAMAFGHALQEDLFGRVSQAVQWEGDGAEPMVHFFKRLAIGAVVLFAWLLTVAGLAYLLTPVFIDALP